MSRSRPSRFLPRTALLFGLIIMSAAMPPNTRAQSPSHLRAVAVYEYLGSLEKPARSRLVPVAVWDGTEFQPAGLYLADPEPLAVESGTLYELMHHGTGVGQIEVNQAEQTASGWIGLVRYLPNPKPEQAKLKLPSYLTESKDFESDTPHFAYTPPKATGVAGPASPSQASAQSGRPTLHTQETPAEEGRPTLHEAKSEPPSLHRPDTPATGNANLNSRTAPPDRPRLFYGKPKTTAKSEQQDLLTGQPVNLRQMVAISDPNGTENHSYVWNWSSPAEEAEARASMEKLARSLLHTSATVPIQRAKGASIPSASAGLSNASVFAAERFHAFQLSWGSGAVYVYSAQTDAPAQQTRYITLIARPDFSGSLIMLYRKITPATLLDYQPRLRVIDAVDATGNGQADLLFEMLTRSARQFAIFQVGSTEAQPVFTTAPQ